MDIARGTSVAAANVPSGYAGSNLSLAIPGQEMTASSMFENDGREPAVDVRLDLSAPQGWQVRSTSASSGTIPTGGQLRGSWLVTPPAGNLPGHYTLTASPTYRWGGYNNATKSASLPITV